MYSILRIATLLAAAAGMAAAADDSTSQFGPTTWDGVLPPTPAPVPRLPSALEPFTVRIPTIFDSEKDAPSATNSNAEATVTSVVEDEDSSASLLKVGAVSAMALVIGTAMAALRY